MDIEFARMAVVYVHLIACCIAIGLVFTSDLAMVKSLLKPDPAARLDARHLASLQTTMTRALLALWITGAAIIALDVSVKGLDYFGNPKLQAKIAIVALLTLNGFALHSYVLPLMKKAGSMLNLSVSQGARASFTGAVSAVSWFYAAMLGIGRPLNWKYSLGEILAAYPVLVLLGFMSMTLLTAWSQSRAHGGNRVRQGSGLAFAGW